MKEIIYLDHNATTPLHPEVIEAMKPLMESLFGNPSSVYSYGSDARTAVEAARTKVSRLIGCKSHEVVFTSGGSEANNMAIKGIVNASRGKGNHIITSCIEHPAVKEVCRYLEGQGCQVTYLPVDEYGLVSPGDLEESIRPDTVLITIMHANNEVGTIQPIGGLSSIAKKHKIPFHTDAAQTAGKIPLHDTGADLISIAAHKLYGPKGVGALYIREGITLEKLIHGADHEQNLRAGTENVVSIVGFGKACEVALRDMEKNAHTMSDTRDLLYDLLREDIPGLKLNGHPSARLPNTLNLSFKGLDAGLLLASIGDRVAASAGAACHSSGVTASETLLAMNVPPEYAMGAVRFSTGRETTRKEVADAATIILKSLKKDHSKQENHHGAGPVQLTRYTHGLGCACKIRPQLLEEILSRMPSSSVPSILVGPEYSDDAAVFQINDSQAIVQTVDFFTPIVDDPYDFGRIAAANSFSDIYAMGAKPLYALNIVGFPSRLLPADVLVEILRGAADKAREAGVHIIGGHTIDDTEPKFGMAVTGIISPDKILRNSTARPGDVLVLTKPIGTGILATALKRGLLDDKNKQVLVASMAALNDIAANVMERFPVSACTDITGFGLLGHLKEISVASGVDLEVYSSLVPLLPGVEELAAAGVIPGGTRNNLDFVEGLVSWTDEISEFRKLILCDAQTSGGLLISLPAGQAEGLIGRLKGRGGEGAIIGRVLSDGIGRIHVSRTI